MNQSVFTIIFFFLFTNLLFAQTKNFQAEEVTFQKDILLNNTFTSAQVYKIKTTELKDYLNSEQFTDRVSLELGADHQWEMELYAHDLRSPNYKVRTLTEQGIVEIPSAAIVTYYGYLKGKPDSDIRLTIAENFIYGFVKDGNSETYIEPARRFQENLGDNDFVIYDAKDVISKGGTCAVTETKNKINEMKKEEGAESSPVLGNCYELDLAIASDFSYYQDRGASVAATEAYTIAVMNNVQNNYELNGNINFDDGVEFSIVEQFVSTCSTCDPWSSSTNPSTLLNSFRSWAPNGFTAVHDLGQLWTDRDFDGSTIGLAYVDVVCNSARYHILQDYSNTAWQLRVLTAHEMGHNFGANHDPASGNIMAPSVGSNTSSWSTTSQNVISANILTYNCLAICGSSTPISNFQADVTSGCEGTMVTFEDVSGGSPSTWNWSFPGGTPSSSTLQNPTVTYNTEGSFNVSLTTSNQAGTGTTATKSNLINIQYNQPSLTCTPAMNNLSNQGQNFAIGVINVSLQSIQNVTPNSSAEGVAYVDYACGENTILEAGNNYTLSITAGRSAVLEDVKAWIDFNGDGDFDDQGEEIYNQVNLNGNPRSQTFTTAGAPAQEQLLVMRVVSDFASNPSPSSCASGQTYGQTEDYGIFFEALGPLPVDLISFTGTQVDDVIELQWATATEVDNDYFTLEHSVDGISFDYLATVNGLGNATTISKYKELDTRPHSGINYYRLTQTDFDGEKEIFQIIAVDFKTDETKISIQPNPVRNNLLNLKYVSSTEDTRLQLQVIDITGKILLDRVEQVSSGVSYLEFPIDNWDNGVYFLRIINNEKIESIKFVKAD